MVFVELQCARRPLALLLQLLDDDNDSSPGSQRADLVANSDESTRPNPLTVNLNVTRLASFVSQRSGLEQPSCAQKAIDSHCLHDPASRYRPII